MKIRSFNTQTSCCSVGMLLKRNLKTPPRSSFDILRPPIFHPKKIEGPLISPPPSPPPSQLKLWLVRNYNKKPNYIIEYGYFWELARTKRESFSLARTLACSLPREDCNSLKIRDKESSYNSCIATYLISCHISLKYRHIPFKSKIYPYRQGSNKVWVTIRYI